MAQHDAFRSARSPARVEEASKRVLGNAHTELRLWRRSEQGFVFVREHDDAFDSVGEGAWVTVGDEYTRARVFQSIAQFWLGMARIQRHHNSSRRGDRHVDFEVLMAI